MPTQHTLDSVTRNEDQDWSNDNGQFHVYTLKAQGLDQLVKVNRKPDSPVLQAGQQVWLETAGTNRDGTLKGRVQKPPDQQQAFQPRNSQQHGDRDESIERQSCIRSAALLYQGTSTAAVDVLATSDLFLQWVQQR